MIPARIANVEFIRRFGRKKRPRHLRRKIYHLMLRKIAEYEVEQIIATEKA